VTPASLENPASTQSSVPGQAARIARSAPRSGGAVLDLRGGLVVRARAGDRDAYAPIVTPLSPGSAPTENRP
jgi:hypothetical protein